MLTCGEFYWRVDHKHPKARKVGGRAKFLGYFDTAEAAHAAYVVAKRIHHSAGTL